MWKDKDQPDAYLTRFERVMKEAEIPEEEWPQCLIPLLTGKVLSAYTNNVPTLATEKYEDFKVVLLVAMGLSQEHCRREFWNYQKKQVDTPPDVAKELEAMVNRLCQKCETKEDFV